MNKKFILVFLAVFFIFSAAACSNKAAVKETKSSNTSSETETKISKIQDIKKEDDKIIQEAIDAMDDLKLDEINDGILNDSELDSILKDKEDPIEDIPTK